MLLSQPMNGVTPVTLSRTHPATLTEPHRTVPHFRNFRWTNRQHRFRTRVVGWSKPKLIRATPVFRQPISNDTVLGRHPPLPYIIYFSFGQISLNPRLEASTERIYPKWKLYPALGPRNGRTKLLAVVLIRTGTLQLAPVPQVLSVPLNVLMPLPKFAYAIFRTGMT